MSIQPIESISEILFVGSDGAGGLILRLREAANGQVINAYVPVASFRTATDLRNAIVADLESAAESPPLSTDLFDLDCFEQDWTTVKAALDKIEDIASTQNMVVWSKTPQL